VDSKEISWRWCTTDQVLSQGPCELISAHLVVSAGSTDSYLYSGTSTGGELIVALAAAAVTGLPFTPPEPVYCPRGLFVDVGTNVTGIFVQWRNLPGKG
jgi:hypothetical protein